MSCIVTAANELSPDDIVLEDETNVKSIRYHHTFNNAASDPTIFQSDLSAALKTHATNTPGTPAMLTTSITNNGRI